MASTNTRSQGTAQSSDAALEETMKKIEAWQKMREQNLREGKKGAILFVENPDLLPSKARQAMNQRALQQPASLDPRASLSPIARGRRPTTPGAGGLGSTFRSGRPGSPLNASVGGLRASRRATAGSPASPVDEFTAGVGSRLAADRRAKEEALIRNKGKAPALPEPEADALTKTDQERVEHYEQLENLRAQATLDLEAAAALTASGLGGPERSRLGRPRPSDPTGSTLTRDRARGTRFDEHVRSGLAAKAAASDRPLRADTGRGPATVGGGGGEGTSAAGSVGGPTTPESGGAAGAGTQGGAPSASTGEGGKGGSGEAEDARTLSDLGDELFTQVAPRFFPRPDRLVREDTLFAPVSHDQLHIGTATRLQLEEEGLFVGRRPFVSARAQHMMENRLFKENAPGWFRDGLLLTLPDPLAAVVERPTRLALARDDMPLAVRSVGRPPQSSTAVTAGSLYEFTLSIGAVSFDDHPLFTQEDALARTLESHYARYRALAAANAVEYWESRVFALKAALREEEEEQLEEEARHARTSVEGASSGGGGPGAESGEELGASGGIHFNAAFSLSASTAANVLKTRKEEKDEAARRRVSKLRADIVDARRKADEAEFTILSLVQEIVRTWNAIKDERARQGYASTKILLKIQPVEKDAESEVAAREADIEARLIEAEDAHIEKWKATLKGYEERRAERDRLRMEKAHRQADLLARKEERARRAARRRGAAKDGTEEKDEEEPVDDGPVLQDEPPPRYAEFNVGAERQKIVEWLNSMRRIPGTKELIPILSYDGSLSPSETLPAAETARLKAIRDTRLKAKIKCNGKLVTMATASLLYPSMQVVFKDLDVTVQVSAWPERLLVELYTVALRDRLLATVAVPIAGEVGSIQDVSDVYDAIDFASFNSLVPAVSNPPRVPPPSTPAAVAHPHEEVVEGGDEGSRRFCKGKLNVSFRWGRRNGIVYTPPLARSLDASAAPDSLTKLKEWAESHNVDVTDPESVAVVRLLGAGSDLTPDNIRVIKEWIKSRDLDPNDPRNVDILSLLRVTQDPLRPTRLFRTIVRPYGLRNFGSEGPEPWRILLLRQRGVTAINWKGPVPLDERMIKQNMFLPPPKEKNTKDIEIASKYLRGRRAAAEAEVKDLEPVEITREHYDVVREVEPPDISVLILSIVDFFKPRRRLRPKTQRVSPRLTPPVECRLHVKIVMGAHLPARTLPPLTAAQQQQIAETGFMEPPPSVQTYVEVLFQGQSDLTRIKHGANPHWNEVIELDIKPPRGSFLPENVITLTDCVYFNVFDRVITVHENREPDVLNVFLGSFSLPFTTLYRQAIVHGDFPIATPLVLPGYTRTPRMKDSGGLPFEKHEQARILLFASLQPGIPFAETPHEKVGSHETEELIELCLDFKASVKSYKRVVEVLVADQQGLSVFICRFIRAIAPPPGLTTPLKMLRFVSLIPNVSDAVLFNNRRHVWKTCDAFLRTLAGDEEEHAVLLCNFFLGTGLDAYLCMGNAIPEGFTAYVLTIRTNGEVELWNAHEGTVYAADDPHIPLKSIGSLVNGTNVWANVQSVSEPGRMKFNLADRSAWKPLLPQGFVRPPTVQPDALQYTPPNTTTAKDVHTNTIQRAVVTDFETTRRKMPKVMQTNFDSSVQVPLRKIVHLLEAYTVGDAEYPGPAFAEIFKNLNLQAPFTVVGAPINLPLMDETAFVEAVRNTKLSTITTPGTRFAAAVHVTAYPCEVYAAWVCFFALVPKT